MAKVAVVERRKSGGDGGSEGRERKREELGLGVGGSREGRTRGEKTEGGAEKGTVRGFGGNSRGNEGSRRGRGCRAKVSGYRNLRSSSRTSITRCVPGERVCGEPRGGRRCALEKECSGRIKLLYSRYDYERRAAPPGPILYRGEYYDYELTTSRKKLKIKYIYRCHDAAQRYLAPHDQRHLRVMQGFGPPRAWSRALVLPRGRPRESVAPNPSNRPHSQRRAASEAMCHQATLAPHRTGHRTCL